MNRYAPPAAEARQVQPSYQLGRAGWVAACAALSHLVIIVVGYPRIVQFSVASPVAAFFVHYASLTSVLLLLGTLLLLARFPSSLLLFIGALTSALLEFRNYEKLLPFVSVTAAALCLVSALKVFVLNRSEAARAPDA